MATQVSMSNEAFASPYRRRGDMAEKAAGDANQAARDMGENRDRLAGGIGDMYAQLKGQENLQIIPDNSTFTTLT